MRAPASITGRRNHRALSQAWWLVLSLMLLAAGGLAQTATPDASDTAIRAVKRHLDKRDAARDLCRKVARAAVLAARLDEAAAEPVAIAVVRAA